MRGKLIACCCGFVALLLVFPTLCAWSSMERKRVFIVHSYKPTFRWTQNIQQGIEDELIQAGVQKSNIKVFYMDTKSRSDQYAMTASVMWEPIHDSSRARQPLMPADVVLR